MVYLSIFSLEFDKLTTNESILKNLRLSRTYKHCSETGNICEGNYDGKVVGRLKILPEEFMPFFITTGFNPEYIQRRLAEKREQKSRPREIN